MNLRIIAAVATLVALAGCGSGGPAGPPTPATLAAKLHCHIYDYFTDGEWAYDTAKEANLTGGPCGSVNAGLGLVVLTFPTQAKENDWLHQNAAAENSTNPGGYFELIVGRLWVIGRGGAANMNFVVRALGGRDTTF